MSSQGPNHNSHRKVSSHGKPFIFKILMSALLGTVTLSGCAGLATANKNSTSTYPAPSITTQPASQTLTAGQTATFSVAGSGTAPLTYQWRKNGIPIPGATSASYTTPATTTSDNGAQFTVTVSNSAGSATSSAATLTVNAIPGQLTAS